MLAKLFFKLYRKQMIEFAFNSQVKPADKTGLEFSFIDSNGKRYYSYSNDKDMPIVRKAHLDKCFMELQAGVSSNELHLIVDAMKAAVNKKDKKGTAFVDLAMIVHLINEIENRKNMLIHPEIMMDLLAVVYIREDENPADVDVEIQRAKVEQFKIDSRGGLKDFFYSAEWTKYVPFSTVFTSNYEQLMTTAEIQVKSLKEQLLRYSSENA